MGRRIIHKLKINEISACDKPAQQHARALIMKRDSEGNQPTMTDLIENAGRAAQVAIDVLASNLRKREPGLTEAQAFAKIYADPDYAALANAERRMNRPDATVGAADTFAKVAAGAQAVKTIEMKAAELRKRDPKLTKEQAFAKVYEDPANRELVRDERQANGFRDVDKAWPPVASNAPVVGATDGYAELQRLAREFREKFPFLTPEQCFARIYEDPANKDVVSSVRADRYGRLYGEGVETPLLAGALQKSRAVDSPEARAATASIGPAHAKMHANAVDLQRSRGWAYTHAYSHAYRENKSLARQVHAEHLAATLAAARGNAG